MASRRIRLGVVRAYIMRRYPTEEHPKCGINATPHRKPINRLKQTKSNLPCNSWAQLERRKTGYQSTSGLIEPYRKACQRNTPYRNLKRLKHGRKDED
jgi:hypothetical protein